TAATLSVAADMGTFGDVAAAYVLALLSVTIGKAYSARFGSIALYTQVPSAADTTSRAEDVSPGGPASLEPLPDNLREEVSSFIASLNDWRAVLSSDDLDRLAGL